MSTKPPSRTIFVGNIPYGKFGGQESLPLTVTVSDHKLGLTEEQIAEIFSTAGKVLNFRLVYDKDTGKPKGFGFAEYPDADSAGSAVRNLNDFEIMGRKLRVDFSNDSASSGGGDRDRDRDRDRGGDRAGGAMDGQNGSATSLPTASASGAASGSLPPLPPGVDLPAGVTATDAISRTLTTLPPAQLLDILSSMKSLAMTEPQRAVELLTQAPQLAYAIFQALLLMGLVREETITAVAQPGAAGGPVGGPGAAGIGVTPTPPVPGYPVPPPQPPAAGVYGAVPGHQPPMVVPPPVVPPPVVQQPPPVQAPPPAAQDPDALMRAVMELPQDVIDKLPETERQQILALRANYSLQRR